MMLVPYPDLIAASWRPDVSLHATVPSDRPPLPDPKPHDDPTLHWPRDFPAKQH